MAENTDNTPSKPEFSRIVRFNRISKTTGYTFDEKPTEDELRAIARALGASSVRKMRFTGHLEPLGKEGWLMEGTLGATVTQPCVVTLEPVRTRLDLDIRRKYVPDLFDAMTEPEMEVPDDDELELLEPALDLGAVALETMALALPDYPRIEGAELEAADWSDSQEDTEEEAPNPFAALSSLKDKLENDG